MIKSPNPLPVLGASLILVSLTGCDEAKLTTAAVADSQRPDFMADIEWRKPDSDKLIKAKFKRGTAEDELLVALKAEDFNISAEAKRAERRLESLPCNEELTVEWTVDDSSRLLTVDGTASEAGCL
jgi:hypothetical protein